MSMDYTKFSDLIEQIECSPYKLSLRVLGDHFYIQASLWRKDARTGEFAWGYGGKYLLSVHMTPGEVIKKCFSAVRDFTEHEIREHFKYKGRAVLGPHIDIEQLWEVAEYLEARAPMPKQHWILETPTAGQDVTKSYFPLHTTRVTKVLPEVNWKWLKWTFGFWSDPENWTLFGIDFGPLEIVWRLPGYRQ